MFNRPKFSTCDTHAVPHTYLSLSPFPSFTTFVRRYRVTRDDSFIRTGLHASHTKVAMRIVKQILGVIHSYSPREGEWGGRKEENNTLTLASVRAKLYHRCVWVSVLDYGKGRGRRQSDSLSQRLCLFSKKRRVIKALPLPMSAQCVSPSPLSEARVCFLLLRNQLSIRHNNI